MRCWRRFSTREPRSTLGLGFETRQRHGGGVAMIRLELGRRAVSRRGFARRPAPHVAGIAADQPGAKSGRLASQHDVGQGRLDS